MYQPVKQYLKQTLAQHAPWLLELIHTNKTGIKYIISGGTSAVVNLVSLYVLTDLFGIWYVASSVVAFLVSHIAGFLLQKFWTFREYGWRRIKTQSAIYTMMGSAEFFLTPILIYALVDKFHIWYLLASVIIMGGVAAASYAVNKFITFKKEIPHEGADALN
ncbi:MAG: GtrA family protein [Parcubacteria group bacterium]|nr:GtrA family protein [Parcubacteria group bacterium]MBI4268468.1 GtrA family protein [Candidatus Uhrbacteria bacterium]